METDNICSIDFETGSRADLKKTGAARYAEDPSTRVICLAYQIPGKDVKSWRTGQRFPDDLRDWVSSGKTISGWNVMFEFYIWNVVLRRQLKSIALPKLRVKQLVDTMAIAAYNGLPLALDMAAQGLPHLNIRKDKQGHALMLRMSRPRKKGKDYTQDEWWHEVDSVRFDQLVAYCEQDVRVERSILDDLYDMPTRERAIWELDVSINLRGMLLDVTLADRIKHFASRETSRMDGMMRYMTGNEVASTRAVGQLLVFAQKYEPSITSLAKDQLALWISKTKHHVLRKVLELRQAAAKSSVAKVDAMLNFANMADNRMRGLYQWGGAFRTLRDCLPAETPVLVRDAAGTREVPIVEVTTDMEVWDGTDWVAHEGVVFSGYHPVIKHDGVIATTKHRVYISDTESVTLGYAKATDQRVWRGILDIRTESPERADIHRPDGKNPERPLEGSLGAYAGREAFAPSALPVHGQIRAREFRETYSGKMPGQGRGLRGGNPLDRGTKPGIQFDTRRGRNAGKRLEVGGTVARGEPARDMEASLPRVSDRCGGQAQTRPPFQQVRGPVGHSFEKGEHHAVELKEIPAGKGTVGHEGPDTTLREHRESCESPTRGHDDRGTGAADRSCACRDQTHPRSEASAQGRDQEVLGGTESRPGTVRRVYREEAGSGTSGCAAGREVPTFDIINAGSRNRFMAWGRIVSNSGRGPQIQNYPRGSVKDQDALISYILNHDDPTGFEVFFGVPPMEALSSALRGCVTVPDGKWFCSYDFAQIEARVTPWLAGDEDLLDVFRQGRDIYERAASGIYKVPENCVDGGQRQIGKVSVLALGFGGGVGAFQSMAKLYGLEITDAEADQIKTDWRNANPKIVNAWYDYDRAAVNAVKQRNKAFTSGYVIFRMVGPHLHITLPSGRDLIYRNAEIGTGKFGQECVVFDNINQYTRQWERKDGYGGFWMQNITQAVARDVMKSAQMQISKLDGVQLLGPVHDELLMELDGPALENHVRTIMRRTPVWAPGLPVDCDGYVGMRFRK